MEGIKMGAIKRFDLNDSLKKCRERYFYERDAYIYHEGTSGEYFYYIVEGLVAVITSTAKEDERLLNIATPGQFLGVQGIYDKGYVTSAVALKDTVVYRFYFHEINELM